MVAALTLLVAPVVAAVTDDLDHVVAYSIVQDMGMVILAFAARDPVWEPLRTWLLVVAVSKSALVGWSVAMRERFGSVQLRDLHGWALHSPVLGGALAFIAVATMGVPTFAVAGVRRDIADAVFDEPLATVAFLVGLLALVPYLRLAAVGVDGAEPGGETGATRTDPAPVGLDRAGSRGGRGASLPGGRGSPARPRRGGAERLRPAHGQRARRDARARPAGSGRRAGRGARCGHRPQVRDRRGPERCRSERRGRPEPRGGRSRRRFNAERSAGKAGRAPCRAGAPSAEGASRGSHGSTSR